MKKTTLMLTSEMAFRIFGHDEFNAISNFSSEKEFSHLGRIYRAVEVRHVSEDEQCNNVEVDCIVIGNAPRRKVDQSRKERRALENAMWEKLLEMNIAYRPISWDVLDPATWVAE